jgi:hypothetical protein
MNSQATSVMAWRLYRSAISARLVYLREIGRTAFWEFATLSDVTVLAHRDIPLRGSLTVFMNAAQVESAGLIC